MGSRKHLRGKELKKNVALPSSYPFKSPPKTFKRNILSKFKFEGWEGRKKSLGIKSKYAEFVQAER